MQDGCRAALGVLRAVLAEFQRAVAAAHRYERLKGAGAAALARNRIRPADIPRRIFDEFYASTLNTEKTQGSKREGEGGQTRPLPPSVNYVLKWNS
jgi:hypothetical protein